MIQEVRWGHAYLATDRPSNTGKKGRLGEVNPVAKRPDIQGSTKRQTWAKNGRGWTYWAKET